MSTVTPPSPRWPHVRAAFHAYARWLVSIMFTAWPNATDWIVNSSPAWSK